MSAKGPGKAFRAAGNSIKDLQRIMPEKEERSADIRSRNVRRLKKYIILMLLLAAVIPVVLCIILLTRVFALEETIGMMSEQLNDLTWIVAGQQEELEELTAAVHVRIKAGPAVTGRGSRQVVPVQGGAVSPEQDGAVQGEPEQVEESGQQPLHRVYLTFDDGPSIYTDDILEILDRYDVKATFFVVGKESESDREALTMIVDGGHTLGMHSYSHKYAELYQSVEDFADDFVKLQSYLYEVTGVECRFYRFPGGSSNTVSRIDMQEFADYLESQDVQYFDWNISSGDAGSVLLSADALVRNSTRGIRQNDVSIILFHDSGDKPTTVEALPTIIENILAMEDTVILPITEDTEPVQHIQ